LGEVEYPNRPSQTMYGNSLIVFHSIIVQYLNYRHEVDNRERSLLNVPFSIISFPVSINYSHSPYRCNNKKYPPAYAWKALSLFN
jgi:hypothetical protein